jgi:branched-chain amino acid transport system ATP-binding protein
VSATQHSILSVSGLSVAFGGIQALSDVTIEVAPNSIVGLIGPNGAGKTTLFNSISGLVTPTSGIFTSAGNNHKFPKPHELHKFGIARTLQGVGLFGDLTVLENVMIGDAVQSKTSFLRDLFGLSGKSEALLKERAESALAWTGALALAHLNPAQLTYPDSKRVALARALVSNPKVLLLDEPAAGLGQDDIDALTQLLFQLKRKCAILIVEHHVDFVSKISDYVYVLNFGKKIAEGSFDEVKRNPEVIEAYLGHSKIAQQRLHLGA